jgi:hypothetical protein
MLQSVLNAVFGCSHRRTTFPQTPGRGGSRTYVACLECGKEFSYDWGAMLIGQPVKPHVRVTVAQPSFR